MQGKFVVFEGCDGVGKTTLIKALKKKLIAENVLSDEDIVIAQNPDFSDFTTGILSSLSRHSIVDDKIKALCFLASILHNINSIIAPAVERGKLVLCDRYYLSTVVYHNVAAYLVASLIDYFPDYTFLLVATPETTFSRVQEKGENENTLDQHKVIDRQYLQEIQGFYDRTALSIQSAEASKEEVLSKVYKTLLLKVLSVR